MNASPKSLKDLVELAVQRRDLSGLGLSQLAAKNGIKITTTTINAIRQGTYKYTPKAETLRALAWLAGVDEGVAFAAAGQPVPGPPFAEELPPGVDRLSPKSRRAAIDMLRVLVDLEANSNAPAQDDSFSKPSAQDELAGRRGTSAGQKSRAVRRDPKSYVREDEIPLPENWRELAAGAPHESQIQREREWDALGEESQDHE